MHFERPNRKTDSKTTHRQETTNLSVMILGDGQPKDPDAYRLYGLAYYYGEARLGSDDNTAKRTKRLLDRRIYNVGRCGLT